jgi:Tfp pilus assembly protein PilN
MAARKKQSLINLLPQEEFAGSTLGRVLLWALSTFRIIVIVTEMVVMLAFLSRFWLDARNVDLNDLIKQKQAVLAATADFEKDFRDTQKRLSIFSSLSAQEKLVSTYLATITLYLPPDTTLESFSYSAGAIQIKGNSVSETSVAQLVVNLEDSGNFESVGIANIDSSVQEGSLITFTLRLIPEKGK